MYLASFCPETAKSRSGRGFQGSQKVEFSGFASRQARKTARVHEKIRANGF
jgi:hypothetical protein